jgi:hypothetical protein
MGKPIASKVYLPKRNNCNGVIKTDIFLFELGFIQRLLCTHFSGLSYCPHFQGRSIVRNQQEPVLFPLHYIITLKKSALFNKQADVFFFLMLPVLLFDPEIEGRRYVPPQRRNFPNTTAL